MTFGLQGEDLIVPRNLPFPHPSGEDFARRKLSRQHDALNIASYLLNSSETPAALSESLLSPQTITDKSTSFCGL